MDSSKPQGTLLVIEDEKEIRRFVCAALRDEGYQVAEAATHKEGLVAAGTRKPDLIVLDLGLPDGDGVDFIREFRGWSAAPIIVLSARVDEAEKVRALDAGADDYVEKPFGVAEVLARVRASLRRNRTQDDGSTTIAFGNVEVDLANRRVTRAGEPVQLTPIEYRLLTAVIAHPGKVLTHRQLLREVWGPSFVEHNHYLRIYMGHLRHKLEEDPTHPKHLLTETGIGYRFFV